MTDTAAKSDTRTLDGVQEIVPNTSTKSFTEPESTHDRWLRALLQAAPNLPKPIAEAVVDGVARGPMGTPLTMIDQGLSQIEEASLEHLTGSEVRVLSAILRQMNRTVLSLDEQIARLYGATGSKE